MRLRQRAFSLIEIMIAVAVVGALAAIALPNYHAYVDRARVAKAVIEIAAAHERRNQAAFRNASGPAQGA